jgi:type 1 glutamine amidotransferase
MKAALFVGGWEGHTPSHFAEWYRDLLDAIGFEVDIYDTLEPLERPDDLADLDLITPIWSSARSGHQEEFGNMTKRQEDGLLQLIGNGCGLAGWHGHMGDAFRDRPTYHFLIGG